MRQNTNNDADNDQNKIEVLNGVDNVINAELEFFSKTKKRIDTCMNYTRPQLAILLKSIKEALVDTNKRGVRLRYLTEITRDNISYCKDLMTIVDEIRHLDGIKVNFMVSESEYLAPLILFEKGKISSQIIYSNVKELVEQQQYIFDSFWSKAIPANQKIKEIEEGVVVGKHYQTRFLERPEEVSDEIKQTINRLDDDCWSICSTFDGLLMMTYNKDFEMQRRVLDSSRRGKNTRWIGTIDKDNINLVKTFLDLGMKIKHIKSIPPMNFAVSSKEMYATIDEMKNGQIAKSLLTSNEPAYVKHYNSIFEELWKNGVDAADRIKDIEEGVNLADIEVIANSARAQQIYLDIVKAAKEEILWIFPTTNAFIRQDKIGAIALATQAAKEKNFKVRILVPANNLIEQNVQQLKQYCSDSMIIVDVRYIEQMSETKATILVVDRKESLVMELRDDTKTTFHDAIGLSTYSNSKAGVLSYVAIFENLWVQSKLYEQLKLHDKMQKEFINIAAHELRTPIQPVLSLSEVLYSQLKNNEQQRQLLDAVIRNAKRLRRLTEDILDVSKIESQSLVLKKEQVNVNHMILNVAKDYENEIKKRKNMKLEVHVHHKDDIFIEADKERLNQVISNLLDNALKFTKEGAISIILEKKGGEAEGHEGHVVVSVKDTGTGIDPEILPRLFTKFTSKSYQGTGLGLFISKSIIEAHDGSIWAENNSDGKGAIFAFSLPIK